MLLSHVSHHQFYQSVFRFLKKYEDCFSLVVLSQFAASVFAMCFCCLQLSRMKILSFDGVLNILFMVVILAQLYFYCYYGQLIFDEVRNASVSLCLTLYFSELFIGYIYLFRKMVPIWCKLKKRFNFGNETNSKTISCDFRKNISYDVGNICCGMYHKESNLLNREWKKFLF